MINVQRSRVSIERRLIKFMLLAVFSAVFFCESFSQSFLNGDFEINKATSDHINISNFQFNTIMENIIAYGTNGNMDIIASDTFCGAAQQGAWYVAMTGGGTDAISMKLSQPLIEGKTYSISFYKRQCTPTSVYNSPLQIGLSVQEGEFGTLIYTSPGNTAPGWNQVNFEFVAPNNGRFITVKLATGNSYGTWYQLDNFNFRCPSLFDLGNDTTLCYGETLNLNPAIAGAGYLWQDGSVASHYTITAVGTYWVTVTIDSCTKTDSITVGYKHCRCDIHIPNAFTPNGDNLNDKWVIPRPPCVQQLTVSIYNRYGQLIYHSNNYSNDWGGIFKSIPLPAASYVYVITAKYYDSPGPTFKGHIIILR